MKTTPTLLLYALVLLTIFSYCTPAFCQDPFSKEGEARFYTGISPIILPKDGLEINSLNNLTSFWLAVNQFDPVFSGSRVADRYRFTRVQHLLRLTYGFSQSGKWDLGAEMTYTHSRIDNEARSSPLRVLGSETATGTSYRGLSMIGLRLRVMPFETVPELTAQLTAHFPVNGDEELREQLGAQRNQLGLTTTYYNQFNTRTFYFLQADWRTRLSNDELDRTTHTPSVSGYLVFDIYQQQWYLFPGLTYAPTLQQLHNSGSLRRINQQLLGSLGLQLQAGDNLGIMLNGSIPFILESGSVNTTWVRESYSAVTLGIRVTL